MIDTNFLGSLFGCNVQKFLSTFPGSKHFLGLMATYLSITLSDTSKSFNSGLLTSCAAYILFFLTTKLDVNVWFVVTVLLFSSYVLNVKKQDFINSLDKKENVELYSKIQRYMLILALSLTLVGSFVYFSKNIENESVWSMFINNAKCEN